VTEEAGLLARAFWPGPLTLLFAAGTAASRHLTMGTGRVGVRVPSSDLCLKLASLFGFPNHLHQRQPDRRAHAR